MRAFSLVELSIVLVILGLLTGGILAGQSLIRAAELRSVSSDFQRYQTAIRTFQDKYMALPGDMPNATRFWPSAINGNGDGLFGNYANQGVVAWQHLSLAGLIEGSYPGTQATPGSGICIAGTECPPSRISTRGYLPLTNSSALTPPYAMDKRTQGILLNSGNIDWGEALLPSEVWGMDAKFDDGRPGTGMFIGMGYGGFNNGDGWSRCASADDGAAYDVTRTDRYCRPYWLLK